MERINKQYDLSILHTLKLNSEKTTLIDNVTVKCHSQRYTLFLNNNKCVNCGIEGTVVFFEKTERKAKHYHANLYAQRNDELILMTKDHIIPKSKGGKDNLANYQTMCYNCNHTKGNKILDFNKISSENTIKVFKSYKNPDQNLTKKVRKQIFSDNKYDIENLNFIGLQPFLHRPHVLHGKKFKYSVDNKTYTVVRVVDLKNIDILGNIVKIYLKTEDDTNDVKVRYYEGDMTNMYINDEVLRFKRTFEEILNF